ncbi:uncharacterized protein LOC131215283 [Anopheles bellator]|uniref:uncharacterized protein LOC131215283 n=1 Tax=Anopheles bellator TaxID=139047 RepID=UPI0026474132|nr:uncharacterized protein LOC131215283 [Anopheles bellator]
MHYGPWVTAGHRRKKCPSSLKHLVFNVYFEDIRSYKKNPGSGTEGYLNQLRLSTLYFSRLAATGKRFEIGVEVATAGKFDDIVMYLVDERQYCLVQAKHKQDESKRITLDDLLKTTTEYSLPKYFDSFLGLKQEAYCREDQLRYIVIYTNLNVDEHVMKVLERVHQSPIGDTFLDTLNVRCNGKKPTLYRFNIDNSQFTESLIDRISPICEVARKLAEQLVQRKKISINPNGVFHEFHALLARDVFDLDRQLFQENFLAGDLTGVSECVLKFRHLLERTLRAMLKLEPDFSITDLNAMIGAGKLKLLFEPGFLCKPATSSRGPTKEWADYRVQRTEVVEFFQHLILAADQPNFIELEAITKVEVFGLRDYVDECMQVVFDQVDRWIRDGEGVFLGATDWQRICDESRARITGKKWLLKSEEYQKTNPATGYLFERNSLLGPVQEFLGSTQHDTLLLVAAYKAEVSAARILQVLGTLGVQFVVFDAHCFRDIEDLESCIPFVRHLSDRLIVVVFGEQCCQSVTKNVRYKFKGLTKAKTVYIIAASGQDWLEEIKLLYRDVFELADMAAQSRRQLLEKKITLQTREVRLVDVMSEDDALQLIDMEIISQLLTNQLDPVAYSFKYQRALQGHYFARTLRSDHSSMDEAEFDRLVPCNRVVILSDGPGMGKTTFLERFIDRLSSALPDHVICLMHLKFYTETIEEITQLNADTLSVEDAIRHVTKCFFAESTRFGQVLFRNAILNTGKLIVLVDGYDSVIWRYKKSVVRACQLFLRAPFQIRNLLLATRPHELDYLRGALPSAKIVSLRPFGERQCVEFLSQRWQCEDHSEAYRLLRHLAATYGDWVAGSPFQLKLLADLHQQRPDTFRCFGGLLELYLERQFYASNQRAIQIMGIGQQRMAAETLKRAAHDSHRELSAALTFSPGRPVNMAPFTYLLDIGMIVFEDGRVRFEHRVVQEYFAAEALMVGRFEDEQLRAVLANPENRFLHRFLEYHLAKEKNAPYRDRFRRYLHLEGPAWPGLQLITASAADDGR